MPGPVERAEEEEQPDDHAPHYNMGNFLMARQQYPSAIESFAVGGRMGDLQGWRDAPESDAGSVGGLWHAARP